MICGPFSQRRHPPCLVHPAASDKLLIVNHPMPCNGYGFPGHLSPWNAMSGGFAVNILPRLNTRTTRATTSSPTACATTGIAELYDKLGTPEKELCWIEGSDQRFTGYSYFGEDPERLLGWFERHLH